MTGARVPLAVAALGSGVVAGVLAACTLLVVPALLALPDRDGLAAVQSVNRTAVRPVLMTLLFGTPLLCLVLGLAGDRRPVVLVAAALQLAGVVGVTVLANVPLNDALAALDAGRTDAGERWRELAARWVRWNTVRTLAALAAAALLVTALTQPGSGPPP